ncbi:involucrin-like [Pseudoliparis swirei]|uniref:involucrin-like n=1 Tax=Pseudoliparis swirei TaxID=2059687 RepID=UPI0024BE8A4E|nr:involucrin-like [Pseudoliparis swirei]
MHDIQLRMRRSKMESDEPPVSVSVSPGEKMRLLVKQRVHAAVEESSGLLDTLTAAYEDTVSQLREHERHASDVQQLLVVKEEVLSEQQVWISSLDQVHPESLLVKEEQEDQEIPEPPHIKVEQEDQEISVPPNIKEEQEDQENPEHPHIKEEQEDQENSVPPNIKEDQENPEHPHIKEEQEDQDNSVPPNIKEEQEDQENPEHPHIKEEQEDQENSVPPNIKEDQENPEPPHIKEELWTIQEGEQLQGLEEAGLKFSLTPVKSEAEEEGQSSQLHQKQTEQMEIEADGDDCGGPEPARNADTDEETGDSSEPDTDDSVDWKKTREPQSVWAWVLGAADPAG